MKKYALILGLFLVSCGDNVEVETVSLEEILPQSAEYVKSVDVEETTEKDSASVFRDAVQSAYSDSVLVFVEGLPIRKFFPDRLTAISRDQAFIRVGEDTLVLTSWQFKDSLTTVNAFYNWLDCYGDNCAEIRIGDTKNVTKNCVFTAVSSFHLVHVECMSNFNIKFWESQVISNLYPAEIWTYGFSQQKRKGMKWHFSVQ